METEARPRYSRKDYEMIAEAVRKEDPDLNDRMMRNMADIFANDNPRFCRKRFYAACRAEVSS